MCVRLFLPAILVIIFLLLAFDSQLYICLLLLYSEAHAGLMTIFSLSSSELFFFGASLFSFGEKILPKSCHLAQLWRVTVACRSLWIDDIWYRQHFLSIIIPVCSSSFHTVNCHDGYRDCVMTDVILRGWPQHRRKPRENVFGCALWWHHRGVCAKPLHTIQKK